MAQPRGFGLNGQALYTNVAKPIEVNLNFTVTPTNGLGTTSVMSNGYVEYVFMHTSTTPGSVNGFVNPNPAVGYAIIKLRNNFNTYLGMNYSQIVPLTSTSTTALTANSVYTITSLGTTTTAQWQAAGLNPGFTPAVGQTFVAAATASLSGTGTVGVPGVQSIQQVSVVGTPNTMVNSNNVATYAGAQIVLQFSASTSSSVTTLVPAAPAAGTIFNMQLGFDGSSVTIDGL